MSELDVREELGFLLGGVRSLLEQLADSGADEIPSDPHAFARVEVPPELHVQSTREPQPAREPHREPPRERAPEPVRAPPPQPAPVERPRVRPPVLDTPEDADARRVRLAQIEQVAASCTRCALHEGRTNPVFARGSASAELMFVGEGPGADEDAQGLPFVGKAGQLLDRMIVAMGYEPEQVYIANVVKCRPPNNRKPEPNEAAMCVGYLHEQIALVRPKAIVALGATACEGLLGIGGITRLRGTWRLYRGEIPVMPTFHPAYLLRKPEDKRLVWSDLQQVMLRLGQSHTRVPPSADPRKPAPKR